MAHGRTVVLASMVDDSSDEVKNEKKLTKKLRIFAKKLPPSTGSGRLVLSVLPGKVPSSNVPFTFGSQHSHPPSGQQYGLASTAHRGGVVFGQLRDPQVARHVLSSRCATPPSARQSRTLTSEQNPGVPEQHHASGTDELLDRELAMVVRDERDVREEVREERVDRDVREEVREERVVREDDREEVRDEVLEDVRVDVRELEEELLTPERSQQQPVLGGLQDDRQDPP